MKEALTTTESPLAAAREHYRRAVAATFAVDAASVVVQPVHPGLPDNPYEGLTTGALFAVRADFPGADPGPAGFAAADGRVAFARHPDGLKALMSEAGVVGTVAPMLPLDALIARVEWACRACGRVTNFDPTTGAGVSAPTLDADPDVAGGRRLRWYAIATGATGSTVIRHVTLSIAPDGATRLAVMP